MRVFIEPATDRSPATVRDRLAGAFRLARRTWDVREVPALPLLSSGKIDYAALADA